MRKSFHTGYAERYGMGQTFTLILTKGMHIVSAEAAAGIKEALTAKVAMVDVMPPIAIDLDALSSEAA